MNPAQVPAAVLLFLRAAYAMAELCINPFRPPRLSPPPRPPPRPFLAAFPTEIVQLIFDELARDFLSNSTSLAPSNRATAGAVCLTSRAFLVHGRRLLFERVAVRYGERKGEGVCFLKAKKVWWMLEGNKERSSAIRSLEVFVAAYTDDGYLERIIDACTNLEEIRFSVPFSSIKAVPWSPTSSANSSRPLPILHFNILEPCTGTLSTFSASRYLSCREPQIGDLLLTHYDNLHSWGRLRFPIVITLVDCGRDLIVSVLEGGASTLTSFSLVTTSLPRRAALRYPVPLLPALRKLVITLHLSDTDLSPLETVDVREQLERLVRRAKGLESLKLDLDETSEGLVGGKSLERMWDWFPGGMKQILVRVRGREGRAVGEEERWSEAAFLKGCATRGVVARVQRW